MIALVDTNINCFGDASPFPSPFAILTVVLTAVFLSLTSVSLVSVFACRVLFLSWTFQPIDVRMTNLSASAHLPAVAILRSISFPPHLMCHFLVGVNLHDFELRVEQVPLSLKEVIDVVSDLLVFHLTSDQS